MKTPHEMRSKVPLHATIRAITKKIEKKNYDTGESKHL